MKPLILEFIEVSNEAELDFSGIEYSEEFNLNVLKETGSPAILLVSLDTMTGTFDQNESSDADPTRVINPLLDTSTGTKVLNEVSDPEPTRMMNVLDTMTGTRTLNEVPDEDRNYSKLYSLLDTATSTSSQNSNLEITDADKGY